jgi:nicotinamidase-related amidase
VFVTRRVIEIEHGLAGGRAFAESKQLGLSQNVYAKATEKLDRIEGSPQAEVHPALLGSGDIRVSTKKTLDGFYGTELDLLLASVFRCENVVIAGVNTDSCVLATGLSAVVRGYRFVAVEDCTWSMRGEDQHLRALELIARSWGWVVPSADLRSKWAAGPHSGSGG